MPDARPFRAGDRVTSTFPQCGPFAAPVSRVIASGKTLVLDLGFCELYWPADRCSLVEEAQ